MVWWFGLGSPCNKNDGTAGQLDQQGAQRATSYVMSRMLCDAVETGNSVLQSSVCLEAAAASMGYLAQASQVGVISVAGCMFSTSQPCVLVLKCFR